ncbi:MAG TPA: transcriptional regulator [bacterium]
MEVLEKEINETIKVWPTISTVLSTLRTEDQYRKTVKLLDKLIDEVNEKEDQIIESLIDTLGTLIKDYEDRNVPEPEGDPIGCLKHLMEEHNLKYSDLGELGSKCDVLEILQGKRQLNIQQVRDLGKRFNVSPAIFI